MTPAPLRPNPAGDHRRPAARLGWVLVLLALAAGATALARLGANPGGQTEPPPRAASPHPTRPSPVPASTAPGDVLLANGAGRGAPSGATDGLHPVRIRQPLTPPRVDTGLRDPHGQAVTASCASCHATSRPRPETRAAAELDEFHQGLKYVHGELSCLACHHAGNYDRLRLADGRAIEFGDAMQLCAQCHGPQYRDYRHGSHGGMTGHWDLRRGPRERNHCVDCHDPHAPAFPLVRPAFAPAPDRGHRKPSLATP